MKLRSLKLRGLGTALLRIARASIDAAIEEERQYSMLANVFRNAPKGSGCCWRDGYELVSDEPAQEGVYGCPLMRGDLDDFFARVVRR